MIENVRKIEYPFASEKTATRKVGLRASSTGVIACG
jgi:hypothetical protein